MELLEAAKRLAAAAEAKSAETGIPLVISFVDVHGNLVFKERMTGAPFLALEMSERKAYTSALFGMATKDLPPLVQPGAGLYTLASFGGGKFAAFGGGVPVFVDGSLLGGLGISGGTAEQDATAAESALAAFT